MVIKKVYSHMTLHRFSQEPLISIKNHRHRKIDPSLGSCCTYSQLPTGKNVHLKVCVGITSLNFGSSPTALIFLTKPRSEALDYMNKTHVKGSRVIK